MKSRLPLLALALITLVVTGIVAAQQAGSSIATERIFESLGLKPGMTVCEMGAGDGELTIAAAKVVGSGGRVYTSELGDERLKALRSRVEGSGLEQIRVVPGAPDRTNFPEGACDALFMRNVYHHIESPGPMSASLAASLKPGGRLAIVDFTPPGAEAPMPADRDQDAMHGVTPDSVRRELADAGLIAEKTETGSGRWFMVVAARPGS